MPKDGLGFVCPLAFVMVFSVLFWLLLCSLCVVVFVVCCWRYYMITKPSQKAPAFMRGDEWRVLRRVWAEGFPVLPRRKRRDEQLGKTHAALSAGATRQRLDTGASREREFAQRANEDASAGFRPDLYEGQSASANNSVGLH
jgi:hypothetical protein